jgi:hypothetical protein
VIQFGADRRFALLNPTLRADVVLVMFGDARQMPLAMADYLPQGVN